MSILGKKLIAAAKEERTKWAGCFVTNPVHGGKVTCHECNGFIQEAEYAGYWDHQHKAEFPKYHFHKVCYSHYEHYYGIDRPID